MDSAEIHLWTAELDFEAEALQALGATLSPDERARADRLVRESDRLRFIAARGILRRLAGNYLNRPPEQLRFAYGYRGKPALVAAEGLGFSLSHCQGRALFVFAHKRELGVDLESPRPGLDVAALGARFFSPAEAARLAELAGEERERLFYRLWTAKEAYAKARGLGLSLIGREPGADSRFRIEELKIGDGAFGALAYSGEPAGLRFFDYAHEENNLSPLR